MEMADERTANSKSHASSSGHTQCRNLRGTGTTQHIFSIFSTSSWAFRIGLRRVQRREAIASEVLHRKVSWVS